jgi:hypothetical protein
MVDTHLHGEAGDHHRFTVASMVSRRAGRTFSDLACGTGDQLNQTLCPQLLQVRRQGGACALIDFRHPVNQEQQPGIGKDMLDGASCQ